MDGVSNRLHFGTKPPISVDADGHGLVAGLRIAREERIQLLGRFADGQLAKAGMRCPMIEKKHGTRSHGGFLH